MKAGDSEKRDKRAVALFFALLVWAAVGTGLYLLHSAIWAFALYHSVCVIGAFALKSEHLTSETPPGPHWQRIVIGAAIVVNLTAWGLYLLIGKMLFDADTILPLLAAHGLAPESYIFLLPYFAIVNPIVEELFWRGGVFAAFQNAADRGDNPANPHHAILVSSLLFGAWHFLTVRLFVALPIALLSVLLIAGVGYALAVVYTRTRRIVFPILLHAVGGDIPLLVVLLLIQSSRHG